MWVRQLDIEKFRGIEKAKVNFSERQTVLVGPNGAGKSTVLEAFALLFGRDRLVRTLTEHYFYGSNPELGSYPAHRYHKWIQLKHCCRS